MANETLILAWTALSIGFLHTLFGPDHYVPFVAMAKARSWSMAKTALITFLCGCGHVLSSVLLGFIGIALGIAVCKIKFIESLRGEFAAWFLIAFGFTYFIWGLHKAIRNKPHTHRHMHNDEGFHKHAHGHSDEHSHLHERGKKANITPWVLFTIFVFGPCEPLIPLLMYPAAGGSIASVVLIAGVFSFATISTMLLLVYALSYGLFRLPIGRMERYSHALAGLAIFLCGGAVKFLGL